MSAPWPPLEDCLRSKLAPAALASRPAKPPNSSVLAGREHELARIDALLGTRLRDAAGRCSSWASPGWARRRCSRWPGRGPILHLPRRPAGSRLSLIWPRPGCSAAQPDPGPGGRSPGPQARRSGRRWPGRAGRRPPTRSFGCRHPLAPRRGRRAPAGAGAGGRRAVAGPGVRGRDRLRGASARSGCRRILAGGPGGTVPAELARACPFCRSLASPPSAAAMLLPPARPGGRGASGGRDAGQPPRPARGGGAAGRRAVARRRRAPRPGALRRSMARALPSDARRALADGSRRRAAPGSGR